MYERSVQKGLYRMDWARRLEKSLRIRKVRWGEGVEC
jgi:hypothetical protein